MKGLIRVQEGEYKSCGATLHVRYDRSVSSRPGVIEVRIPSSPALQWRFTFEGLFEGLGVETQRESVGEEVPAAFLSCVHINSGFSGKTVIRSTGKGIGAGWICCPECVNEMLSGGEVRVVDREVVEKIVCDREVVNVDLNIQEEGGDGDEAEV